MLRGGMVPALVDGVLKVSCLLRREQRYEEAQHTIVGIPAYITAVGKPEEA